MLNFQKCFKFILLITVVASLGAFGVASDAKLTVGAGGGAGPVEYALDPPLKYESPNPTTLPNDGLQLDFVFNDVPDGSFFIDLELSDGVWVAPAFGDITVTIKPWDGNVGASYEGVSLNANVVATIYGGSSLLRLTWDWNARPITYLSKVTVYLTSEQFIDDDPSILESQGTINLTVAIMEAEGSSFDPQLEDPETIAFVTARRPFEDIEVDPTTALIDVAAVNPVNDKTRVFFETGLEGPTDNDLLLLDVGAKIRLPECPTDLYEQFGDLWRFGGSGLDSLRLQFTNTAGWNPEIHGIAVSPEPPLLGGGHMGVGIPADPTWHTVDYWPGVNNYGSYCQDFGGQWQWVTIAVTGVDQLTERTFSVKLMHNGFDVGYPTHVLSNWYFNGSVLVAHWLQGNTTIGGGPFKSRIYLHSADSYPLPAPVTVQLYELPIAQGDATPAAEPLGPPVEVGAIEAGKGLVVRMEDVLDAAGVALPYIEGLGNIQAVVSVPAKNMSGSYQVFAADGSSKFGMCPLFNLNNNNNQWLWDVLVQFPNVFPPGGAAPDGGSGNNPY